MNAFFASVEQELNPQYRGLPLGVVPNMVDTGCVIAASYEAKGFGVKTGTGVAEAKKICPQIILVEARPKIYVQFHHEIAQAVESCVPITSILSIDEMTCKLHGTEQEPARAVEIATNIKSTIRKRVGGSLCCSVGLSVNPLLAKIAAEMQKPDGLYLITKTDLPTVLYALELQDIPGIASGINKRIRKFGISSVKQLCALRKDEVRQIWGGIVGERFWHWLKGDDVAEPPITKRMIGHSHVLPPALRTRENAYAVMQKLITKAASRLRKMNYWTGALNLFVQNLKGATWESRARINHCQDTPTLLEAFRKLWRCYKPNKNEIPFAVGITLSHLMPDSLHTLSLFEDERRSKLSQAVDAINKKFGVDTVYFGGTHDVKGAAPVRIGFTNISEFF